MTAPVFRLLIPTLIAAESDLRALQQTVAAVPADFEVTIQPVVQFTAEMVAARDRLVRIWQTAGKRGLVPLYLGQPSGKWGALRQATARCQSATWLAVVDGDNAYDLTDLRQLVQRAQAGEADLCQGERQRIVLDPTALGRARALFEPVVNELLRERLSDQGIKLPAAVTDLQSGFFLARRRLLAAFFTLERMDGYPRRDASGQGLPDLPWGYYGGELHLHAFAAQQGFQTVASAVTVRAGRVSGLQIATIGQMLRASALFQGVTASETDLAIAKVAQRDGWTAAELALAKSAAAATFPQA